MSTTEHNVDVAEIAKFDALASRWWDPEGDFRPLHEINPLRLDYIRQHASLDGASVLDVGCGGGILAESMDRAGASVTAIDMAERPLAVAKLHQAESGTTVHAIHHGRVVYSDWLRGSGLLLIIDHGDGYMSLYAHNDSLARGVGEWVNAEEVISNVGNSGGQERAALYFEVRDQGKPVDPRKWCRR